MFIDFTEVELNVQEKEVKVLFIFEEKNLFQKGDLMAEMVVEEDI